MVNKNWEEWEVEYLKDKWGENRIKIAKKLNRSVNAINMKAAREGLGRASDCLDGITLYQLANLFNVSYGWTIKAIWIDRLRLPYKTKVIAQTMPVRYICIDDFWKWANKHKDDINFAELEENILGKEPSWVNEKRKVDQKNISHKRFNRPWTREEENVLKNMLSQYSYTYYDMSQILGRTEGAIKKRIEHLQLMKRPLRSEKCKWWADEEILILIKMKKEGYDDSVVAGELGRTARAVETKYSRILKDPKWKNEINKRGEKRCKKI